MAKRKLYPGDLCKRKKECIYGTRCGGDQSSKAMACYYAVMTGKARDCPADKCNKFISRQKTSKSEVKEIIRKTNALVLTKKGVDYGFSKAVRSMWEDV